MVFCFVELYSVDFSKIKNYKKKKTSNKSMLEIKIVKFLF